jgi:hypothetical protein
MVDNIPSDLSIGQAIWGVDNKSLVFVGWNNEPRRLGLVAFTNRRQVLVCLLIDVKGRFLNVLLLPGIGVLSTTGSLDIPICVSP